MRIQATRHALWFFLILGAMFLASINYQSNAAWLMVFLVLSTGGMSALHAWRNVHRLEAIASLPPLTQAGDRARVGVTLRNRAARQAQAVVVSLARTDGLDVPMRDLMSHRQLVPLVPKRSAVTCDVMLPPFQRGMHRLEQVELSTRYPFGLFEARVRVPINGELIVHPEPLGQPLSAIWPDPSRDPGAAQHSREHDDFRGHRHWQTGESPRHIDWKAAARGSGHLLVKEYAGGGTSTLWISWLATTGDDEKRLSQLAKWVIEAHQANLSFGLRIPGAELEPAAGAAHQAACLRALAMCVPGAGSSARRPAVRTADSGVRPGSSASVSATGRLTGGSSRIVRSQSQASATDTSESR